METVVFFFDYGGRKRLNSLFNYRRKNLKKPFSSTHSYKAGCFAETPTIFCLAVIVCLQIC